MTFALRIPSVIQRLIKVDLARRHAFAAERVGFLFVGAAWRGREKIALFTRRYVPVDDEDYVDAPGYGAMIGKGAFRKAFQEARRTRSGLFHVHEHGGRDVPSFSGIDLRESGKFALTFFNAVPQMPHGVILFSADRATGLAWIDRNLAPTPLRQFQRIDSGIAAFGG